MIASNKMAPQWGNFTSKIHTKHTHYNLALFKSVGNTASSEYYPVYFFLPFLTNNFRSYWNHKSEAVPVRGLEMQEKYITAAQRQLNFPAQQGSLSSAKKSSPLNDISKIEKLDRNWQSWASLTTKREKWWLKQTEMLPSAVIVYKNS